MANAAIQGYVFLLGLGHIVQCAIISSQKSSRKRSLQQTFFFAGLRQLPSAVMTAFRLYFVSVTS